MFEVTFGKY